LGGAVALEGRDSVHTLTDGHEIGAAIGSLGEMDVLVVLVEDDFIELAGRSGSGKEAMETGPTKCRLKEGFAEYIRYGHWVICSRHAQKTATCP
jgi:hypothetical protein